MVSSLGWFEDFSQSRPFEGREREKVKGNIDRKGKRENGVRIDRKNKGLSDVRESL